METLFISDLHLDKNRPEIVNLFLNFLFEYALHADALYILGDFFEFWVGDDDQNALNQEIIYALKTINNIGIPIYLMRGNRDFLIGRRFAKATGCKLLKDPSRINLYGTNILLTHGDILCSKDLQYQLFRKIIRNSFIKHFFSFLSLKKRTAIAQYFRKISQKIKKIDSSMDTDKHTINHLMTKYKINYLIHGHTHQSTIHHFTLHGKTATRIVLGSWQYYGSVLISKPNETNQNLSFQLRSIL